MKAAGFISAAALLLFTAVAGFSLREYVRSETYNENIKKESVQLSYSGLARNMPAVKVKIEENINEDKVIEPKVEESEIPQIPPFSYPTLEIDHESLKARNPDYRAWLTVEGTDISYPVVKAPDNEYYLHRGFDGNYLYAGTLFIDAYSAKGTEQDNLIIYGHNMKNGTMFGKLKKLTTEKGFSEYPYISLYTPNEVKRFLIFSVRKAPADISHEDYVLEGFGKKEYIKRCEEISQRYRNAITDEKDTEEKQIITLVVCNGNSSERLLISGLESGAA